MWAAPGALLAKKKKKEKERSRPASTEGLGIVAGTVFTSDGRALPGARVELSDPESAIDPVKVQTDARGEFAIRAPGREQPYSVKAEAEGFEPASREVYCYEGQRSNVNLLLKPE